MNPHFWLHATLLALGGAALMAASTNTKAWQPKLTLLAIVLTSLWAYANMGKGHGPMGNAHFSEIWHYYLGSKYYKETGHNQFYQAILAAFDENQMPLPSQIRDLEKPFSVIPAQEGLRRFHTEGAPRFTPERWSAFKTDVARLGEANTWKYWPLHDVGYNPPPPWALAVGPLASAIPISPGTIQLLGSLDLALLLVCTTLLWATFGPAPALAFLLVVANNPLSNWFWIGGAFLRNLELTCLTGALCAMAKNRWALAGCALGAATSLRIFPIVFAAGALTPLIATALASKQRSLLPWKRPAALIAGLLTTILLAATLSTAAYSPAHWREFGSKISLHSKIFFTWHMGYEKLAANTAADPNQHFDQQEGAGELANFKRWNLRADMAINQNLPIHTILRALATLAAFWVAAKCQPRTACLIVGETLLFLYTLPANYYYILLALLAASAATDAKEGAKSRIWIALAIPLGANLAQGLTGGEPIMTNFLWNVCLATGLALYLASLAWSEVAEPSRWRILLAAAATLLVATIGHRERHTSDMSALWGKDLITIQGKLVKQKIPEVPHWAVKTQGFLHAGPEGGRWIGSLKTNQNGPHQITILATQAPDYTQKTQITINTTATTLQSNKENLSFPILRKIVHLQKGDNPVIITTEANTLSGINTITAEPIPIAKGLPKSDEKPIRQP
jgi:hypothetical protein